MVRLTIVHATVDRVYAVLSVNFVFSVVPTAIGLRALLNATGAIQHESFDGSSPDQVFADQTVLGWHQTYVGFGDRLQCLSYAVEVVTKMF